MAKRHEDLPAQPLYQSSHEPLAPLDHQIRGGSMTCPEHPRYNAKRRPRGYLLSPGNRSCETCWAIWLTSGKASVTLRKLTKPAGPGLSVLVEAETLRPRNRFVQSVREHYDRTGFVSPKQVKALRDAVEGNYKKKIYEGVRGPFGEDKNFDHEDAVEFDGDHD